MTAAAWMRGRVRYTKSQSALDCEAVPHYNEDTNKPKGVNMDGVMNAGVTMCYQRWCGWYAQNDSRGYFHRNGEWSHTACETIWWVSYNKLREAVNKSLGFKAVRS
jgi:hypothetical protein